MTKHTPEPWAVHEFRHAGGEFWCSIGRESGRGPITDIFGAEGNKTRHFQPVAGMRYLVTPVEEQRANARRIVACVNGCEGIADPSAVKDLLQALREMMRDFEPADDTEAPDSVILARAAIAKAEGH